MSFSGSISKPDGDDREYCHFTLPNGLSCLAISDPKTDKSAAALDVGVGHLCDPWETPGLAHFCEHLLFMGTTKYPIENDYSDYLSSHGGSSNAFTGAENTNYFFEVACEALEGALDRFAQFFICPLFSDSCTDRELNAVDSEHKKNIQADGWRNYQLEKSTCSPGHVFTKFGTGNLQTLKEVPTSKGLLIRDVLLDFHSKYYSANIMGLVVLGKEPLGILKDWIASRFSQIENKNVVIPSFEWHPLTRSELNKEILVKPVKQSRQLGLIFPFPDFRDQYKTKPAQVLSHLIGHEGIGSVLSLLKRNGLAQSLSSGVSGGSKGFDFFRISIELTEKGVESYKEIIKIVFQYIALLNSSVIPLSAFKEVQAIQRIAFKFKEKSSPSGYVSRLAGSMLHYEPADILSGPYLMDSIDPKAANDCLKYLKPTLFRLFLISPLFTIDSDWLKADHYETDYTIRHMDAEFVKELECIGLNDELKLPEPNNFIPENFDLVVGNPTLHPMIIRETPLLRLWYKRDDTFFVPKANVLFQLRSPLSYDCPRSAVLTRLYVDLLKDELNEYAYDASLAGLQYRLDGNTEGLTLSISGYSHKISVLLERTIDRIKDLQVTQSNFERVKEMARKDWNNWFQESPNSHAMYYIAFLSQELLITTEEKLEALSDITLDQVLAFSKDLVGSLFVEGLVHGNLTVADAIATSNVILNRLNPTPLPEESRFWGLQTHKLNPGQSVVYSRQVFNPNNLNSAIEYGVQLGPVSDANVRAMASLLSQCCQEPAFDQLRTKEQLGYSVHSGLRRQTELITFRVIIQSEKAPWFLFSRIESFLNQFEEILVAMDDEKFEKQKSALVTKILEKLKNLGQESQRLWGHVLGYDYYFDQHEHDAELVKKIDKKSLIEFYRVHVSPASPTRRLLVAQMVSQKLTDVGLPSPTLVQRGFVHLNQDSDLESYRSELQLCGHVVPTYPLSRFLLL